jgi:hypothetical protein
MTDVTRLLENLVEATTIVQNFVLLLVKHVALSLVICLFPAILFSWEAPTIEGHSAFIQACDWL